MTHLDVQGIKIPRLGFGTFQIPDRHATTMVQAALEIGYRHIDTAQIYENELGVGWGIRRAGIPRDEIFLTTKVWVDRFRQGELQQSVIESLERLQTDYVDLLLLHWPNPQVSLDETIAALNEVRTSGMARSIGVSNFNTVLLEQAVALSQAPLLSNQVEYHPYLNQRKLLSCMAQHHMALTAYSPLAQGKLFRDPVLQQLGQRYEKSAGQVALRWLIQQPGVIAIPRSSQLDHTFSNFNIFDFELSTEEMTQISALARPEGRVVNPRHLAPLWD